MKLEKQLQQLHIAPKKTTDDRSSSSESSDCEDARDYRIGGYHRVNAGDVFYGGRYRVLAKLGWGHFSTVWLAFDMGLSRLCAIKVQKSSPHYTEAAQEEVELLKALQKDKNRMRKYVVEFYNHFEHQGPNGRHMCLTFEVMSKSLLALIKHHNYKGVPIPLLKQISRQILEALCYVHDTCNIIHTDLKPENILFVPDPEEQNNLRGTARHILIEREVKLRRKVETIGEYIQNMKPLFRLKQEHAFSSGHVKIVDFGNACFANRQFTNDIQTRQYRAPEVILEYGYNKKVDIWSVACIVFELATGEFLFDPREGKTYTRDEDHIGLMIELLGSMTTKMRTKGALARKIFDRMGNIHTIPRLNYWGLRDVLKEKYRFTHIAANELSEFLLPMLQLDPTRRVSAREHLNHPYLQSEKASRSTNNMEVNRKSKPVVTRKSRLTHSESTPNLKHLATEPSM